MNSAWDRVVHHVDGTVLGAGVLRRLIDGDVPVVVLKGLIPEAEMAANRERLLRMRDRAAVTQYANGSLTLIGTFLVKYLTRLDAYFAEAAAADARVAEQGFDLAAQARARLRAALGLRRFEVAAEPDGRRYASSNVRICSHGVDTPLHNDKIVRDGAAFPIALAGLRHQLSCVVCVQGPGGGGELSIWRKPWHPDDEVHKIPDGLGYDRAVVAGAPSHFFRPESGDVYLLNPTLYHAVEAVQGTERMTLGFFFGFFDDELAEGVTWV